MVNGGILSKRVFGNNSSPLRNTEIYLAQEDLSSLWELASSFHRQPQSQEWWQLRWFLVTSLA